MRENRSSGGVAKEFEDLTLNWGFGRVFLWITFSKICDDNYTHLEFQRFFLFRGEYPWFSTCEMIQLQQTPLAGRIFNCYLIYLCKYTWTYMGVFRRAIHNDISMLNIISQLVVKISKSIRVFTIPRLVSIIKYFSYLKKFIRKLN